MGQLHAGSPDISCKRHNPGDERIFLGGKTIFLGGQKPEEMAFSVYRFLIAKQNHSFNAMVEKGQKKTRLKGNKFSQMHGFDED